MEPEKQEIKRNPDGTFPPGVSGNPRGRTPGPTLKEFARQVLMTMPDDEKLEFMKKLPPDVIWKMAEGNPAQDVTSGGEKINPSPIYVQRDNGAEENKPPQQAN